jgi:hypothetical protein
MQKVYYIHMNILALESITRIIHAIFLEERTDRDRYECVFADRTIHYEGELS